MLFVCYALSKNLVLFWSLYSCQLNFLGEILMNSFHIYRIWNAAGECVFLLQGHSDVITSLAPIPSPGSIHITLHVNSSILYSLPPRICSYMFFSS